MTLPQPPSIYNTRVVFRFTSTAHERSYRGWAEEQGVAQSRDDPDRYFFYAREGEFWIVDERFASAVIGRLLRGSTAIAAERDCYEGGLTEYANGRYTGPQLAHAKLEQGHKIRESYGESYDPHREEERKP